MTDDGPVKLATTTLADVVSTARAAGGSWLVVSCGCACCGGDLITVRRHVAPDGIEAAVREDWAEHVSFDDWEAYGSDAQGWRCGLGQGEVVVLPETMGA